MNSIGAAAQLAAAKVKGNDLHPVRAQCVRVQDFKDGAETDDRVLERSIVVIPAAGRMVPTVRADWERIIGFGVLPPRRHLAPVFDISAVLVQYLIPFVA